MQIKRDIALCYKKQVAIPHLSYLTVNGVGYFCTYLEIVGNAN